MNAGIWGPVTATVDWCESNYALTPLVAELFNTASSLAMVVFGVAGLALHRSVLPRRYLAAFALLVLVGLGSVAFHATLRFELQLADELPMLWLVLLVVWILHAEKIPGRLFPSALVAWGLVLSAMDAFPTGQAQFWAFQVGFGSLELFSLYSVWRLQRTAGPEARRLFRLGMGSYATGIAVWFVDLRFCELVGQLPQLHALWHVLVSLGFYALLLTIALAKRPGLGLRWGPLPQVSGAAASASAA